jgi:hypothetical protein
MIVAIMFVLCGCDTATVDLGKIKLEQSRIDSLWAIEISDSLKNTTPYSIKSFGLRQSGKVIRLDNLKIENWPEDILSFHDILYTEGGRPIAAQDAILGHAESCLSRHYFNSQGKAISRLIDNWYYDDSIKIVVEDRKIEFYDVDMEILQADSIRQDNKGNKFLKQVSKPRLDGKVFPQYETADEFTSSNKIEL